MVRERGTSLMEILVVTAIIAMVLTIAAPNLSRFRRNSDFLRLAKQIDVKLNLCRREALTTCRNVGLVFGEATSGAFYSMVVDGDSDGVSRADMIKGVDRRIGSPMPLEFLSPGVHVGVPVGWRVPDPSGRGYLPTDGQRTGRWDIVSFSHLGNATPSSIYFNDSVERMLVIRVSGEYGRIRVLEWRRGWPRWQEVKI